MPLAYRSARFVEPITCLSCPCGSTSSAIHLSVVTSDKSVFAVGFTITATASQGLERPRAYPGPDEDFAPVASRAKLAENPLIAVAPRYEIVGSSPGSAAVLDNPDGVAEYARRIRPSDAPLLPPLCYADPACCFSPACRAARHAVPPSVPDGQQSPRRLPPKPISETGCTPGGSAPAGCVPVGSYRTRARRRYISS